MDDASKESGPFFLMEDDAVMTEDFEAILNDVPDDADVLWLGRSGRSRFYETEIPQYTRDPNSRYQRIQGMCRASHAILLITDKGKASWKAACEASLSGMYNAAMDLNGSVTGSAMANHYFMNRPFFYQPDHEKDTRFIFEN